MRDGLRSTLLKVLLFAVSVRVTSSASPVDVQLRLAFLQRMSDVTVSQENCESGRWVSGRCWLGTSWQASAVLGLVALDDFNARNGSSVPAFANLDGCDKRLVANVFDSGSTAVESVAAVSAVFSDVLSDLSDSLQTTNAPDVAMLNNTCAPSHDPVAGLIGPARSDSSLLVGRIASAMKLPQLSYYSTTTELNDPTVYPYFGRTMPTDEALTRAMCALWKSLGYSVAGILYPINEVYGESFNLQLRGSCSELGVGVISMPFVSGTEAGVSLAVNAIADLKMNVGVIAVSSTLDVQLLMPMFLKTGLLGTGTAWGITDSITVDDLVALPLEVRAAIDGLLFYATAGGAESIPQFLHFAALRWPTFNASRFNAEWPAPFHIPENFFTTFNARSGAESALGLGAFEYDAVAAFGLLVCEVAPQGPLPANYTQALWSHLTSGFAFDGLSGRIRFDTMGNRDPTSTVVRLGNIVTSQQGRRLSEASTVTLDTKAMWDG